MSKEPAIVSQEPDRDFLRRVMDEFVTRHKPELEDDSLEPRALDAVMHALELRLTRCKLKRGRGLRKTLALIRAELESGNTGGAFRLVDRGLEEHRLSDPDADREARQMCLVAHDQLIDRPGQIEVAARPTGGLAPGQAPQCRAEMGLIFRGCMEELTSHWTAAVVLELPLGQGGDDAAVLHAAAMWLVKLAGDSPEMCWVLTFSESKHAMTLSLTRLPAEQAEAIVRGYTNRQ